MTEPDPRIYTTATHLRQLQSESNGISFLPRTATASVLNGRHTSRLRGRGLDFQEMRNYLPGDDVRSIDWKTTAKTGKPFVRVMTEERDRPAMLVVDQRVSMFFGSVLNMKSVTAAEAAAIAAFRIRTQGDRVGGVVFNDSGQRSILPSRGGDSLTAFIAMLSDFNQQLAADVPAQTKSSLNQVLGEVSQIAHHNHLIIIFSDFEGVDETTKRRLSAIAEHNDLILVLTHDPIARDMRLNDAISVTDGTEQAELNFSNTSVSDAVRTLSADRLDTIMDWQKEINLSILPLSAGEPTLAQIRNLLGSRAPTRRVR